MLCLDHECCEPGGALKGGMPLYKYTGNKILTTVPE